MNIEEFRQKRIEGRKQLQNKIVNIFESLNPVAIHQFGSGASGFKDEFSDIDIWITFDDNKIDGVIKKLNSIFRQVAPVLIRHNSKSWSPVGGSANSVIHDTEFGLFVVDYYISKLSGTILKEDSKVLYGDDSLKRGEWILNKEIDKDSRDSHTLKKDINLILDLLFVSSKIIARKSESIEFENTLKTVHKNFLERYTGKIKRRRVNISIKFYRTLLSDIYSIADSKQKTAIDQIRNYIQQIEELY